MSIFFRKVLELGVLLSCLMLALTLFQSGIFIFNEQPIPQRFYVIWAVCFITLGLSVCFSIKSKWKTIGMLSALIVMFLFGFITIVGFNLIINNLFEEPSIYSLGIGLTFLIIGSALTWVTFKCINSKN